MKIEDTASHGACLEDRGARTYVTGGNPDLIRLLRRHLTFGGAMRRSTASWKNSGQGAVHRAWTEQRQRAPSGHAPAPCCSARAVLSASADHGILAVRDVARGQEPQQPKSQSQSSRLKQTACPSAAGAA